MAKHNRVGSVKDLLIIVSVVALFAAIAFPSFKEYVQKKRRATDGLSYLLEIAEAQKYFAQQNDGAYVNSIMSLGYTSSNSPNGYYLMTVDTDHPSGFLLSAVPTMVGNQHLDPCGTLMLTADMEKSTNKNQNNSCW